MKNIYVMTNPSKVSGRGLLQGVLSYAATCFDWTINVLEPTESGFKQMFAALDNKWADGIVTSELENPEMRNRLERSNMSAPARPACQREQAASAQCLLTNGRSAGSAPRTCL